MRKMVVSVLALGALAVPAYAQAPQHGEKAGYIATVYAGEVLPGQTDKFKQVAAEVIAAVAKEPGTLMYEWNMRADGKSFDVVEVYQNSEAMIAHVNHVVPEFGKALGEVDKRRPASPSTAPPTRRRKRPSPGSNPPTRRRSTALHGSWTRHLPGRSGSVDEGHTRFKVIRGSRSYVVQGHAWFSGRLMSLPLMTGLRVPLAASAWRSGSRRQR